MSGTARPARGVTGYTSFTSSTDAACRPSRAEFKAMLRGLARTLAWIAANPPEALAATRRRLFPGYAAAAAGALPGALQVDRALDAGPLLSRGSLHPAGDGDVQRRRHHPQAGFATTADNAIVAEALAERYPRGCLATSASIAASSRAGKWRGTPWPISTMRAAVIRRRPAVQQFGRCTTCWMPWITAGRSGISASATRPFSRSRRAPHVRPAPCSEGQRQRRDRRLALDDDVRRRRCGARAQSGSSPAASRGGERAMSGSAAPCADVAHAAPPG